jgi:cystathionine beta-lyase/cystathionine gamma-synthase
MIRVNPQTTLLHYRLDCEDAQPAVTPIYQTSAFTAESEYFYSRKNNPNTEEFEHVVAILENARFACAFATGMSSIYALLDLLNPGSKVILNKYIYGCSYKLFQKFLKIRNISLEVLDLSENQELKRIGKDVSMIFFETPTNPFLKTVDIKSVTNAVRSVNPGALVVVDNTWATSLFQKPLEHGADISLYSCTKYFSGHSDVMGGVSVTNNEGVYEKLKEGRFYSGSILSPFNAWLLRRSMQTFAIRMYHHRDVAREMVSFLKTLPYIENVYYPTIDGDQLLSYGGIIFFEFADGLKEKYLDFRENLTLFETGTGMACVVSMVAQPYTGSHASMSDKEKDSMGVKKSLVRLCFGLEDIEDLKKDLLSAFKKII